MSPDELKHEQRAVEQMSSWKGPEYRAELENIVAQQRAENPHQTTREMLMLKKIHNDKTEQRKFADQADGITRDSQGQSVIPRAEELSAKWERHQSQAEADLHYKMKPEELTEYQITLQKAQAPDSMTRAERSDAAAVAAEKGDMEAYRRLRRS